MELYEEIVRKKVNELEIELATLKIIGDRGQGTWESIATEMHTQRRINELEIRLSTLRDVVQSADDIRKIVGT